MISYIVSAYGEPPELGACLACLKTQSDESEIIVCDNNPLRVNETNINSVRTLPTGFIGCQNCYESANLIAPTAAGEWLCFPSHDSLYVRAFSKIMLSIAKSFKADLVYCDCVYSVGSENSQGWKSYSVLNTMPSMGRIDKTCFILRRELFKGFPPHPDNYCDGALIEQLVAQGARHTKAPGVLVLHQ